MAAQVAERLAEVGKADRREIEREMADGQILLITYQHMPGGGLTVTIEDRTEERRAQQALTRSEERYALVAEAAEEGLYEWDIAQSKFFVSQRLTAMLGVEADALGHRDWLWEDRVHPDDLDRYRSTLAAHIEGSQPRWDCEYRFRDSAGGYRWIFRSRHFDPR